MNIYIDLLDRLIATPSISREEAQTAQLLEDFLRAQGVSEVHRLYNNLWACSAAWDDRKPTLLLNSHHDTVKPSPAYTRDPFTPTHENGRIYGLGSNDAGASLVGLTAAFLHYYNHKDLPFNLLLALTAEEEVTGLNGSRALMKTLLQKTHPRPLPAGKGVDSSFPLDSKLEGNYSHPYREELGVGLPGVGLWALVGEPTRMQCAVAERGLLVLDGVAHGRAGHAARNEGVNALYIALDDIQRLRDYQFERESELLGPIKISVTQIEAGTQHNVVPAECHFVVDVRTTDAYTNEEVVSLLQQTVTSDLTPRSTHIRASAISMQHPLVQAAQAMGIPTFTSPTTSDQSQMPFPSIKMGPGDSARSHMADEWVGEQEVLDGIDRYIAFIKALANLD